MKILLTIIVSLIAFAGCNSNSQEPEPTAKIIYIEITSTPTITSIPIPPTATPQSTATPEPTPTPQPTNTPVRPTSTPRPTATPTPPPPTPTPTMTVEELRCRDTIYPGCPGYTETVYFCPHARHCKCKILERDLTYRIADCANHKFQRPPTRTPAPTPTLAYSIDTITRYYSAPKYNVHSIPVQFETHIFRDDGTTYPQDVCYDVKYRDRQGALETITLKFSIFDYNQQSEHIQLYERSSPGTFDDADEKGIAQALTKLKNKEETRRFTCN